MCECPAAKLKLIHPVILHSSFVVFYFVFVFRLPSDVNHGATAFLIHLLAPAEHSGEELFDFFNILFLVEDAEERRAAARH